MKRVGFWLRVLAVLIDVSVVLVVSALVVMIPTLSLSQSSMDIIQLSAWLAYTTAEVFAAGTLGKRLMGLRIANADGSPAGGWTLFLRWSTKQYPQVAMLLFLLTAYAPFRFLGGVGNFILFVGCLAATNDSKQAWHDQWGEDGRIPPARPRSSGAGAYASHAAMTFGRARIAARNVVRRSRPTW